MARQITRESIIEICRRFNEAPAPRRPGTNSIDEWAEARGVSLAGVHEFAVEQTKIAVQARQKGVMESIEEALMAVAIVSLQVGVELEFDRRNRAELPGLA